MSRELPILCTAPAVRAILDGRQTQTRRLVLVPWGKRSKALPFEPYYTDDDGTLMAADEAGDWHVFAEWGRKPWRPSDVLYVREAWAPHNAAHPKTRVDFRADMMSWGRTSEGEWMFPEPLNNSKLPAPARWRPAIHMPKWAARIRLRVLSIGVERVNTISEEDAMAEGIRRVGGRYTNGDLTEHRDPVAAFGALWDRLYGAGSFHRGDWCWVTRFERMTP